MCVRARMLPPLTCAALRHLGFTKDVSTWIAQGRGTSQASGSPAAVKRNFDRVSKGTIVPFSFVLLCYTSIKFGMDGH